MTSGGYLLIGSACLELKFVETNGALVSSVIERRTKGSGWRRCWSVRYTCVCATLFLWMLRWIDLKEPYLMVEAYSVL